YALEYPHHDNIAADVLLDPDPDAVAKAFDEASVVVEGEYRAQRQYQAYIEPKSSLARFENGRFIVHTASQFPFNVRDQVAQFLGVRTSDVRVLGHHIGAASERSSTPHSRSTPRSSPGLWGARSRSPTTARRTCSPAARGKTGSSESGRRSALTARSSAATS